MNTNTCYSLVRSLSLIGTIAVCLNSSFASNSNGAGNQAQIIPQEVFTKLQSSTFNDALFTNAYQTFIYNAHIEDAYKLALIAVSKKPNDIDWHERLAQAATWFGDYNVGLKEWLLVEKKKGDIKTISHVIKIAQELGYDEVVVESLELYLAKKPKDAEAIMNLAYELNRVNKPEKALSILTKLNRSNPSIKSYALTASIHTDMGNWDGALINWNKLDKTFGPTMRSVMAQAVIYYSRNQFSKSLDILTTAIPIAQPKNTIFWQTLGDMAFMLNNKPLIYIGYKNGKPSSGNLTRLIEVIRNTKPEIAEHFSSIGWNKYQDLFFFSSLLYLEKQLNHWENINNTYMSLTPKQISMVQNKLVFWEVQAAFYGFLGANDAQKKVLINGFVRNPNLLGLLSDLLWIVNGRGEYLWTKSIMQYIYQRDLIDERAVWHAFTEGFVGLNKFYSALVMYQRHLLGNIFNDQILIDYGSALEKADLDQQALNMREFIWKRALRDINIKVDNEKKIVMQSLAQLAPYFASGTEQAAFMNALFTGGGTQDNVNILLNWVVPRSYYDLIYYVKYAYLNGILPDWAGINLALIKNDTQALQDIMTHTERDWPRSDRINAAVRLENKPLAVDYDFRELTDRRLANEIYPEFTLYGLELANHVGFGQEYEQFINLIGPRTYVDTKFRLTNSLRIFPKASIWWVRSNQPLGITNVPAQDARFSITLEQIIHRGKALYTLGVRNALNTFVPASIKVIYTLAANVTAIFSAKFNEPNLLDSYMFIGGVEDQLSVLLEYNYTKRDLFTFELQGLNYYGQDRHYLGDGVNILGYGQHKFWLNYPDFTVGTFAHAYIISRNGSLGGDITTLFPALTPQQLADPEEASAVYNFEYQQVLPNSYYEGGFTFSVGDVILEYTHSWRPYFWSSVYYNTLTQLSYNIKGGINGSVFGRDSLLIYAEQGTAPATVNATTYRIGARYMLHF